MSPAPILAECLFSMTLPPGADKGYLKALQQYYRELDVRGFLLVDMDERGMEQVLPQPMPLATFDDFQRKHMREASDMLRTELVVKVVNICQAGRVTDACIFCLFRLTV